MIWPFLLGVGATVGVALAVGSTFAGRPIDEISPEGQVAACAPGLVFFAPGDSVASRAIDAASGGYGFSHVAVQGCEVGPGGVPLLVDCRPGSGVHRRPETDEVYQGRARGRLLLTGPAAAELYGCARARVGADYAPFDGGYLCARLASDCLPAELRARVAAAAQYAGPVGMVSPNQIAAAFGVRPGRVVIL